MTHFRRITSLAAALVALGCTQVLAQEQVDPTTLYEVTTQGTSTQVKAGEQGVFVLSIKTQEGRARLRRGAAEARGEGQAQLTPAQEKLAMKDSVAKKAAGQEFADPRFEVPFKGRRRARARWTPSSTFFICTEQSVLAPAEDVLAPRRGPLGRGAPATTVQGR